MADSSSKTNPQDPAQKSLGDVLLNLPAVRAAKKVNTLSRVHRRLIEPIETEDGDDARLAFQHTVFCQTSLPGVISPNRRKFRLPTISAASSRYGRDR